MVIHVFSSVRCSSYYCYCFLKSQIELKTLAEEMQAATKGLEKVEQELMASENDGAISLGFRKVSCT